MILFVTVASAAAEETAASSPKMKGERHDPFNVSRSLREGAYVVETDDDSARESLNRVSGKIDLGFLAPDPDEAYHSSSHLRPGLLGDSSRESNRARDGQY